ncbi:hypothetical protein MM0353_06160 [Helicobacter pylori]
MVSNTSYPFKKIKQNFKNFKKMSFYNKMGVKMIKQNFLFFKNVKNIKN